LKPELPCVFPPRDEVKRLHELTLCGDLFAVQERADALAQDDTTFQPFAAKLTHLARAYQDDLKEECD
jgi:hypothetical protein